MKKVTEQEKIEINKTKNHVVRSSGFYGTWGRGWNLLEAMKNAKVTKKDSFDYWVFRGNDAWDIFEDGRVTWKNGGLILFQHFENGVGEDAPIEEQYIPFKDPENEIPVRIDDMANFLGYLQWKTQREWKDADAEYILMQLKSIVENKLKKLKNK